MVTAWPRALNEPTTLRQETNIGGWLFVLTDPVYSIGLSSGISNAHDRVGEAFGI